MRPFHRAPGQARPDMGQGWIPRNGATAGAHSGGVHLLFRPLENINIFPVVIESLKKKNKRGKQKIFSSKWKVGSVGSSAPLNRSWATQPASGREVAYVLRGLTPHRSPLPFCRCTSTTSPSRATKENLGTPVERLK